MDIDQTSKSFHSKLSQIKTSDQLEKLKISYLGRNGQINSFLRLLKDLPQEEKRTFGDKINNLKKEIENAIGQKTITLAQNKTKQDFDTSLPGKKPHVGHFHPTTQMIFRINAFFRYLGYSVYEGPEIETDEYNFAKLNLPQDHPARDLQDTLYIKEPQILLRTHTSSVETRALTNERLPIRIVVPGKSYRNETSNATNNSIFYQYEGLVVDQGISMAHLKGTLIEFVKWLYGPRTKTRFRCKYYPQVEPGAGLDVECTFCWGKGCSVCKYRGYIEVLGAGMVHPNELKACNIDPAKWSGFAFGLGLDRLVMLHFGIEDIRKLYDGSLTFVD